MILPGKSVSPAAFQVAASQAGAQGRVITAVAFDGGKIAYLAYGWQRDQSTIYEAKVVRATFGTVAPGATGLAREGYVITAIGGNYTDGFILVGTRPRGQDRPAAAAQGRDRFHFRSPGGV